MIGDSWVSMHRPMCPQFDSQHFSSASSSFFSSSSSSSSSSLDDALWIGFIDADFGLGFIVRKSGEGHMRERRGGRGGGCHVKRRVDKGIRTYVADAAGPR